MGPILDDQGCDILVVIAHPDDEVFTSGVICLCVDKGRSVKIVSLTDGEGGQTDPEGPASPHALASRRRQELAASARALGVRAVLGLQQPDVADPGALGGWDVEHVVDSLAAIVDRENPSVILTHGPLGGYGHDAHKTAYRCVMAATQKIGFQGVVYSFCAKTPNAFSVGALTNPPTLYSTFVMRLPADATV